MNKELIEMIDAPQTVRGKILLHLATHGETSVCDMAAHFGCDNRALTPTLNDMLRNANYIELSKRNHRGRAYYTLVSMKCKMSEARTVKAPRYKMEPSDDAPLGEWRRVFVLMDSCCG